VPSWGAEAFREIELACRCDPLSVPINSDLGFHYQYDEAVKLKFVLEMSRDLPPARLWLGRTYQEPGRVDDALAELRYVEASLPKWPGSMAHEDFAVGAAHRPEEAHQMPVELERLSNSANVTPYGVALVHAGLGSNDVASRGSPEPFRKRRIGWCGYILIRAGADCIQMRGLVDS